MEKILNKYIDFLINLDTLNKKSFSYDFIPNSINFNNNFVDIAYFKTINLDIKQQKKKYPTLRKIELRYSKLICDEDEFKIILDLIFKIFKEKNILVNNKFYIKRKYLKLFFGN